jgi:hypothetical protein
VLSNSGGSSSYENAALSQSFLLHAVDSKHKKAVGRAGAHLHEKALVVDVPSDWLTPHVTPCSFPRRYHLTRHFG